MQSGISTSISLIARVRRKETLAWNRFSIVYSPLILRWCKRTQISAEDAADVVQEVLAAVDKSISDFDRKDGQQPFRAWLFRITSNKIIDVQRKRLRRIEVELGSAQEYLQDDAAIEGFATDMGSFEQDSAEDQRLVVHGTLASLRDEFSELHWKCFWRTSVDGQSATAIADELGLKPSAVRKIKSRVTHKLRAILEDLEEFG